MYMDNIFLIITSNKFPSGDAGAVRLKAFADILLALGYSPYVYCMGETTNFKEQIIDDIYYCSFRYPNSSLFWRIVGRLLYDKRLKKYIHNMGNIKGILVDSGKKKRFVFLNRYAHKHDIPLIFDSVEWYSPSEFKWGTKSLAYRHNNDLNTKIIDSNYKVIAISKYLESNFKSRGIDTIRIPVIMDIQNITPPQHSKVQSSKIKIVYAGSIGRKDHIRELIEAIGQLTEIERERIEFCVMGITKEQYERQFGNLKDGFAGQSVLFMGRVSRDTVLEQLGSADFSFLLRPTEERYAKAGFPTKVVEGLASGVPILCNYSSDLELYLKDGENSIIIEGWSADACVEALKKVLSYSREELDRMRVQARITAEENFDWRLYVDLFEKLIH